MSTTKQADSETRATLSAYMRDVLRHPVMTKNDEALWCANLIALRRSYYREVLSYAPFTAAALDMFRESLKNAESLEADFSQLTTAARGVRDSGRKAPAQRFAALLDSVSAKLGLLDPECTGVDRVANALDALANGSEQDTIFDVNRPRTSSRPFADYVGRVHRTSLALRNARNRFAQANLRLVVRIATRFHHDRIPLHDRVQEGNLGLMKAIDRFDISRGFRFSTYAQWWIKHAIRRAASSRGRTIRIPEHIQTLAAGINKARISLRTSLEREPSPADIANALELPVEKVEKAIDAMAQHEACLDAPIGPSDDSPTVQEALVDTNRPSLEELLCTYSDAVRLHKKLLVLPSREQDILRLRFGLDGAPPQTLQEIGLQQGLSRERIRQLHARAIDRLRRTLETPTSPDG